MNGSGHFSGGHHNSHAALPAGRRLRISALGVLAIIGEKLHCEPATGSAGARHSAFRHLDLANAALSRQRVSSMKANPTESEIRDWCVAYLARTLKLSPERIDPQAKFARLGLDSAASVFLVADLEDWLGVDLSAELIFEHQTPAALARYLARRCASPSGVTG
jgi:acyl carrier protein